MEEAPGEAKDMRGLHDVNDASRLVRRSHWWLRKLAKRGSLACVRVGPQRRLMFSAAELLKLLEAKKNDK